MDYQEKLLHTTPTTMQVRSTLELSPDVTSLSILEACELLASFCSDPAKFPPHSDYSPAEHKQILRETYRSKFETLWKQHRLELRNTLTRLKHVYEDGTKPLWQMIDQYHMSISDFVSISLEHMDVVVTQAMGTRATVEQVGPKVITRKKGPREETLQKQKFLQEMAMEILAQDPALRKSDICDRIFKRSKETEISFGSTKTIRNLLFDTLTAPLYGEKFEEAKLIARQKFQEMRGSGVY